MGRVMKLIQKSALFTCFLLCITPVFAATRDGIQVEYKTPKNKVEQQILKDLQFTGVIDSWAGIINEEFVLPEQLRLVIGSNDGPLFDPEKVAIEIPYSFVSETKEQFIAEKYRKTEGSGLDATMDILLHTLFHEFSHAIIVLYDLPITGREEDAADGLATLLLIEFFEDGQEIALSAADLFDLQSQEIAILEDQDFWDEHSLDAQRYYSTLCYVYGSAPGLYDGILQDAGLPAERKEFCLEEYDNLYNAWFTLLKPYLKFQGHGK